MTADIVLKHETMNPCCTVWKERYSKMKEQRTALRQGLNIYEQQIGKIEAENCNLKKAIEDERLRADIEREEKGKESAIRVTLENEISVLKSQILLLQQKGGPQAQEVDREVLLLQTRASEGETEINRLKELLERERIRADSEKKKAEAEKKKANEAWKIVKEEKSRADEERKLANIEGKKAEEYRLQLETLKSESDEARSKLVLETFKSVEVNKKLEEERQQRIKEKKRADLEMAKTEEQRKLAEKTRKKAMDEKCRADYLSQQLEEHRRRIEKLQKKMDELVSSRKLVEAPAYPPDKQENADTIKMKGGLRLDMLKREADESKLVLEYLKPEETSKRLEEEKQKVIREKKRADAEMRKAEEQRKVAEVNRKKALEEKHRADQLAQQLEDNKRRVEELQKEIQEFLSSKKLVEALVIQPDKNMNAETAKMKLLKKQLKFEKMRVKHAKQVAKLDTGRNNILQQELCRLKQELVQFSHHLDILDNCFLHSDEGIDDLPKAGNLSYMRSFNLKGGLFSMEPYQMKLHGENDIVKPICTSMDASDFFKQNEECRAPLLPKTGGNCTECISGIDSKLEPLPRGSNRKMLQSSAINSSMASFSDRPLVGSQDRCAFSVTASAKFSEEKSNLQPTISRLSGEVTKMRYNENLAVVAENSVKSPISVDAVARRAGHSKKRKRILDAVESIEHLYSEGKKWHLQIEEKLSMLQGMLNSQMDKPLKEGRCLARNLQGNLYGEQDKSHKKRKASPEEEVILQHLCDLSGRMDGIEEANVRTQSNPTTNKLTETAHPRKDGLVDYVRSNQEILGSFDNVEDGDYMKLLDLDNAVDEECFRAAIEMPLSPSLPEIEFQSSETFEIDKSKWLVDENSYKGFSSEKDNLVPYCDSDVINVETDSNKFEFNDSRTSCNPLLHWNEGFVDYFENITDKENGMHNTIYTGNTSVCQNCDSGAELGALGVSYTSISGNEGPKISYRSELGSARDGLPKFCVVFSDTKDNDSISRIFCAIRTCMAQCSMISQTDWVVRKVLPALLKVEDLLPKEKVCVFFSLVLHNFSGITLGNLGNFLNGDSIPFLDSFAGHICAVMSDVETRSMFSELCHLDELLTLIEDFLIDRRVLVYSDVSSESSLVCDSRVNILLNGADIMLSFETASTHQLLAGGIVLASICAAVDHIGFICEASYNIFRIQKFDSSSMLTILHVFAYLCGSKYFTLNDYRLLMTVLKSLVNFIERANLSTDSPSCLPSPTEVWPKFPSCTKRAFSEGAVSMDIVISLLLEKLQNCAFSATMHQDLMESANSLSSGAPPQEERTEQNSDHEGLHYGLPMNCNVSCYLNKSRIPTTQSNCVFNGTLCHFSDILSLVELVACYMSWDWICNNIVCQLLKMLESCVLENFVAAVVLLLGQLGRLGVDANGYEDTGVENLRCRLSVFLCQDTSRKLGLSIQIATVTALLGLLPLNFEELIKNNMELPAVVSESVPAECIRKWFSLLSNEQQSLSFSLLQSAGMSSCRTG
uniref:Maternal effect embryo arrest 22 n=1 Tax=Davidia involucrata TaxID=16924 RepID=A0A5B7BWU3_DAVIN